MKYTRKESQRSFKEGFYIGYICYKEASSMNFNAARLSQLLLAFPDTKLFNTMKKTAEKARVSIEKLYAWRSKMQKDYPKSFLENSGILKIINEDIKRFEHSHRDLCEGLAYYMKEKK